MKQFFLSLFICSFVFVQGYTQCNVSASAVPSLVCPGEPVYLWANTNCGSLFYCDFNDSLLCTGFAASPGIDFTNPCGPGYDSVYAWMGEDVIIPRTLTTNGFAVGNGCYVSFYLRFAIQSHPSPCEGPDLVDEGVSFQYSKDVGATWTDIAYFRPDGVVCPDFSYTTGFVPVANGSITNFTQWVLFDFSLPVEAQSADTRFRWIQHSYSQYTFDHWGIDSIAVYCDSYTVQWEHGPTTLIPSPVYPVTDTCYIIHLTDLVSGTVVSDTVCVQIINVDVTVDTLWNGFSANASGHNVSYQWVDCNNGYLPVVGEINQVFVPGTNGSYAVIVTIDNCSDTSDCYTFVYAGIEEVENLMMEQLVYPNPASNMFYTDFKEPVNCIIYNLTGVRVKEIIVQSGKQQHDISTLPQGIYGLHFIVNEKSFMIKLMVLH